MNHDSSLPALLVRWYKELGIIRQIVYPVLAVVFYGLSVLLAVAGYWAKTDMGYNMFSKGGWHAFSRCLVAEIQQDK